MSYRGHTPEVQEKAQYIQDYFARMTSALTLGSFPDHTPFSGQEFHERAKELGFEVSVSRIEELVGCVSVNPSPPTMVELMAFAEVFEVAPGDLIPDYFIGNRRLHEHVEAFG